MLIVTYHAIAAVRSRVTVSPARLAADLSSLVDAGWDFLALDAAVRSLAAGVVPVRAVALTFDDGYLSVATEALPLLARLGVPATTFVIGGRLGLDNRWPGQPRSVPPLPLVDAGALRELAAAGFAIGAHSASHRALPSLDDAAVHAEMIAATDALEQVLQQPVRHFAYPYGGYGAREIAFAAARFDSAVTADCRAVTRRSHRHALPRLDAHDLAVAARLGLLTPPALPAYLAVRRLVRGWVR